MHATILKLDKQQVPTVEHRKTAQGYVVDWMGRELRAGNEYMHMYG